jgi:hypothetical protein
MQSYRVECFGGASHVVTANNPRAAAMWVRRIYRQSVRSVCLAKDTARQLKDQPNLL